jgi:hypothetical protein
MKMLGHEDISVNQEAIFAARFFQQSLGIGRNAG